MFDQVEVNFKSLKLIKKCKNTTTTKTKNLTLNTFLNNAGCVSVALQVMQYCFVSVTCPGWTFWSSLVTQFCGTPKSCSSWWMNIQTTHRLLFRKWVDLIPQLLQLHVDTSLGQMLTLNNSRCIHLELCVKIKICLCICILLLYLDKLK